ncbi:molybdenum cofactor synthesis protein 3 / molybdopterin synthase sulfurylase, putative [Babesia caballi]|uniref:Molybdenum cofactor synthesis protein 3 / molybdopterin synthase sulphurylase, putative n=1 Tax=Babesia caballi TaxID=5871 RepID=A0AAV4M2U6_BABCB|nr:molybdenum cofactor synthesis protein 3 / molybdopterin synthase sulphurylase, putative [Babesia caballi]
MASTVPIPDVVEDSNSMYGHDGDQERCSGIHVASTVDDCRRRSEIINIADPPNSGCLVGGLRNGKDLPAEELLRNRVVWAPLRSTRRRTDNVCTSIDPPFCTALSQNEAERFGAQYIALQRCGKQAQGGFVVDATATCAVLVVGAGGLGAPILLYLAAGGIGIIGVMDGDVVETSNLHRQVIHDEANEGMNKAASAKLRMTKLHSQGTYIAYERFCGKEEAENVVPLYDIIVDATDNPQTRYLLNDACVKYRKILVIASSIGTQGQLMVFNHVEESTETPCFRCICPLEGNQLISPKRGACSFAGVLGSIPGVMGCLQATEILKLAAGAYDAALGPGRMVTYDATNTTKPFKCIQLKKNPECTVCGVAPENIRIEMMPWETCTVNEQLDSSTISNRDFWRVYMDNIHKGVPVTARLRFGSGGLTEDPHGEERTVCLVDVRPKEHYALCHLTGATSWVLGDLLDDIAMLGGGQEDSGKDESRAKKVEHLVTSKCLKCDNGGKVVVLFICFLGNSSKTAVSAVENAIGKHAPQSVRRIKCFSVAGGYRAIRTKLGISVPLA